MHPKHHNIQKSLNYAEIAKAHSARGQKTLSQLYYFLAFDSQKNVIESILRTEEPHITNPHFIDFAHSAAKLALLCGLPQEATKIAQIGLKYSQQHFFPYDKQKDFLEIGYENELKKNQNFLLEFGLSNHYSAKRFEEFGFETTAAQVISAAENELIKENANIDFAKTYELLSILLSNLSNKGFSFDENFAQMFNNVRILCKDISVSGNNTKISTYKQAKWCIGLISSYIQDFDLKYPAFVVADCYSPQPIGLVQPVFGKIYDPEKRFCYGERNLEIFTIARHKAAAENPKLFPIKGDLVWGVPSIEKGKFFFVDESN